MSDSDRPVGRPSKYNPAYCEQVIDVCREGYSLTGFAGKIGVSRECLTKWGQEYPEFLLALKRAKAAAAYGIETDANRVRKVGGGPGAASMCTFQLKNFASDDYADRQEHLIGGNGKEPIRTETIYSGVLAEQDKSA